MTRAIGSEHLGAAYFKKDWVETGTISLFPFKFTVSLFRIDKFLSLALTIYKLEVSLRFSFDSWVNGVNNNSI